MSAEALCEVRSLLAQGHYETAVRDLRLLEPDLARALSGAAAIADEALAHYHMARLLFKGATHPEWFTACKPHHNAHILVFDHSRSRLLLSRRGHYKWLFPNTDSLSVCKHGGFTFETAKDGLAETLRIVPQLPRLHPIGAQRGHASYLRSLDFCAFMPAENARLRGLYAELASSHATIHGVLMTFAPEKRTLSLFVLDSSPELAQEMQELGEFIQAQSGLPAFNAIQKAENNSMFVYILSTAEEQRVHALMTEQTQLRAAAWFTLALGFDPESPVFPNLPSFMDADRLRFEDWEAVKSRFAVEPRTFALDLCYPYFGSPAVVRQISDVLLRYGR
jgi:hypothetical protein